MNNAPSIIKFSRVTKCFALTDDLMVLGDEGGWVSLVRWAEEDVVIEKNIFEEEEGNMKQVISISEIQPNLKSHLLYLVQSRGGNVAVVKAFMHPSDNAKSFINILSYVKVGVETFSKYSFLQSENLIKILSPSEKENQLLINIIDDNNNYSLVKTEKIKLFLTSTPPEFSDSDSEDDDQETPKSLLCNIVPLKKNEGKIIFGFESSVISLHEIKESSFPYISSVKLKSPIITINELNDYIGVGVFGTLFALYTIEESGLKEFKVINDACSSLKPGVSTIAQFKEETSDFIIIGGYDKRIKFYQLPEMKPLGNLLPNITKVINQIETNQTNLFVCANENNFFIYEII